MSDNSKTYIISGKAIRDNGVTEIKRAKVKFCYTELHAKMKFEKALKLRYPDLIRCEVHTCSAEFDVNSIFGGSNFNDVFKNFGDIFGKK